MSIFAFGEQRETIGRFYRGELLTVEQAMLTFDDSWARNAPTGWELISATTSELAEEAGVEPSAMATAIAGAIRAWRVSPSRSLINIIRNADLAVPGQPMFAGLVEQSRVLGAGVEDEALPIGRDSYMRTIRGEDRKQIKVAFDAYALTAIDDGPAAINRLARAFHLWELRNRAIVESGRVRLPKALYRGVRSAHIDRPAVEHGRDDPYAVRSCRMTSAAIDHMGSTPFWEVSKSPLLSFTPNESVAEFFTRDEGFVVEVDPNSVGVVSCWATDEALAGKDVVTGRQEREWILRMPRAMTLEREQVRINDRTWHVAMGLPDGIRTLHHETGASYELDGHKVEARWVYRASGIGGALAFTVDGNWPTSRASVKKAHGFDPIPSGDRAGQVQNLSFFEKSFTGARKEHPRLDPVDFEPTLQPPSR